MSLEMLKEESGTESSTPLNNLFEISTPEPGFEEPVARALGEDFCTMLHDLIRTGTDEFVLLEKSLKESSTLSPEGTSHVQELSEIVRYFFDNQPFINMDSTSPTKTDPEQTTIYYGGIKRLLTEDSYLPLGILHIALNTKLAKTWNRITIIRTAVNTPGTDIPSAAFQLQITRNIKENKYQLALDYPPQGEN